MPVIGAGVPIEELATYGRVLGLDATSEHWPASGEIYRAGAQTFPE